MMEEALPFGRTQTTASEYEELIDPEAAASYLEEYAGPQSVDNLRVFIQQVPELLSWLEEHGRVYPWRKTTDPWRVYISEILLQRTSSDTVAEVYDLFFERFPDPESLAEANEEDIRDVVYSLGFINQRSKCLKDTARYCIENHGGAVPEDLEDLKTPWRVGPYSARACLLFAFGQSVGLVDSNIVRVLERVFDYKMPNDPHKKDEVYEFVETLTPSDPAVARSYYFALLDLGALICKSENPDCEICPIQPSCAYYRKSPSQEGSR